MMSQHRIKQIHLIYGIVLTALVILLGVALVLSCLDIYYSTDRDPYSPASVAQAFDRIGMIVWITVGAIIGGIALELALPLEKKRPKSIIDDSIKVERLRRKLLTSTKDDQGLLKKNLAHRRSLRRILMVIPCILSLLLMIYPAFYFAEEEHFTISNLNADIIKAVLIVMLPAIFSLGLFFLFSFFIKRSLRKEAEYCKLLLAEAPATHPSAAKEERTEKKWIAWCVRGGLLLFAVAFIALGVANGGAQDVLKKAIAICTECIGLG